ncbi:MAG: 3-phosphoserine/phosphohydroxythreonine transaminase [Clostridiales bacterium]|nr:3-phosphoserine/phosphohydroxythreonine transaminase [Clostridiales bacterium]
MMRVYNFSAGPSMLPLEVLKRVQSGLTDYDGTGMSVMEMSHRSKPYDKINNDVEALLRQLMNIPNDYDILFVQGGATNQFSAVPLNIGTVNRKADYVLTGNFAKNAYKEGCVHLDARVAASSEDKNFTYIPRLAPDMFRRDADYVHICYNNTIFGTCYDGTPDVGTVPLVADMSSIILGRQVNVSDFSLIYAGAQKNMGPAGVTVVIVKHELTERAAPACPVMLRYDNQVKSKSLYNTPPCFSTYVIYEVLKYLKEIGGIAAIQKINERKAAKLYDYIDNSAFYSNPVQKQYRSIMNVPFVSPSKELDDKFVTEAATVGLVSLKGHRLVGGMRASIYNAMPEEGVDALIEFMDKFKKDNS